MPEEWQEAVHAAAPAQRAICQPSLAAGPRRRCVCAGHRHGVPLSFKNCQVPILSDSGHFLFQGAADRHCGMRAPWSSTARTLLASARAL